MSLENILHLYKELKFFKLEKELIIDLDEKNLFEKHKHNSKGNPCVFLKLEFLKSSNFVFYSIDKQKFDDFKIVRL